MLLCCFRGRASRIADAVICKLLSSFQIPGLASFTSWTHHCGPLHPDAAVRVSCMMMYMYMQSVRSIKCKEEQVIYERVPQLHNHVLSLHKLLCERLK